MLEVKKFDAAEVIEDAEDVVAFLNAAVEDGGISELPRALGTVARSKGMSDVAARSGLGRESLYKALSGSGNPTVDTLARVIEACGLEVHLTFTVCDAVTM